MHDDDPAAARRQLALAGQVAQRAVVVAFDGLHGGDKGEPIDCGLTANVSGVQDEVHASQPVQQPPWEFIEELRAVGVCDNADSDHRLYSAVMAFLNDPLTIS